MVRHRVWVQEKTEMMALMISLKANVLVLTMYPFLGYYLSLARMLSPAKTHGTHTVLKSRLEVEKWLLVTSAHYMHIHRS